jgi:hypothetical protein
MLFDSVEEVNVIDQRSGIHNIGVPRGVFTSLLPEIPNF